MLTAGDELTVADPDLCIPRTDRITRYCLLFRLVCWRHVVLLGRLLNGAHVPHRLSRAHPGGWSVLVSQCTPWSVYLGTLLLAYLCLPICSLEPHPFMTVTNPFFNALRSCRAMGQGIPMFQCQTWHPDSTGPITGYPASPP